MLDRASVVGGRKEVVWSGDDHGHTSCAVFGEASGVGSLSVHSEQSMFDLTLLAVTIIPRRAAEVSVRVADQGVAIRYGAHPRDHPAQQNQQGTRSCAPRVHRFAHPEAIVLKIGLARSPSPPLPSGLFTVHRSTVPALRDTVLLFRDTEWCARSVSWRYVGRGDESTAGLLPCSVWCVVCVCALNVVRGRGREEKGSEMDPSTQ